MILGQLVQQQFSIKRFAILLLGGAILSVTGPFGTYALPLDFRASFWFPFLALLVLPLGALFDIASALRLPRRYAVWIKLLLIVLAGIVIALIAKTFLIESFFPILKGSKDGLLLKALYFLPIVVCLVLVLQLLGSHSGRMDKSFSSANDNPVPAYQPFLDRLPKGFGPDLIWISSDDHYLNIKSENAEHLELMTLGQACEELEHFKGFRVHRSYWVAQSHILSKKWKGSTLYLEMSDGKMVPVGRTYRKLLLEFLSKQSAKKSAG